MKIMITGGFGFIGSALSRHCLQLGHKVMIIDSLTYAANTSSVPPQENLLTSFVSIVDRYGVESAFSTFRPDIVFHLAAESHVDNSIKAAGVFFDTNVIGTWTMLEVFRAYYGLLDADEKHRTRFIHVSTDEVFGETTPDQAGFNENTRYDPRSPYAASKAGSDHIASSFRHTYGLPISITNCCNNYGPWQHHEKLLPKAIANTLIDSLPVPVYGEGDQFRQWLFVDDHVSALMEVIKLGNGNYMIGGDHFMTNLKVLNVLAKAVHKYSGKEMVLEFVQDRPGHDKCYKVDDSTFRNLTGWSPKTGLEEGFAATVRHIAQQYSL